MVVNQPMLNNAAQGGGIMGGKVVMKSGFNNPSSHKSATTQPVIVSRKSATYLPNQNIIKRVDENNGDNLIELPSLNLRTSTIDVTKRTSQILTPPPSTPQQF